MFRIRSRIKFVFWIWIRSRALICTQIYVFSRFVRRQTASSLPVNSYYKYEKCRCSHIYDNQNLVIGSPRLGSGSAWIRTRIEILDWIRIRMNECGF
jgi:hypothetical protein